MVGVAGKSKGCHTCRKRKIRCDQTRPTCGQCNKTGRQCEGYARTVVFLNNFAAEYDSSAKAKEQTHRSSTLIPDKSQSIQENRAQISTEHVCPFDTADFDDQRDRQQSKLQLSIVHLPVSRPIGFEHLQSDHALHNFISCSLPVGAKEDVPLLWLYSIPNIAKDSPVLPLAASALTYAWTGHVESLPEAIAKARSFYVGALQHLNQALTEDPFAQSDATLAASAFLALYEMYEFGTGSKRGWMAHLSGVEALVKLRGPQMHVAGLGHEMFLFFRTIAVFRAIIERKSTFLSDSEWKHIPWSLYSKNSFHQFLDLAVEVPCLLERADALHEASLSSSTPDIFRLFDEIRSLLLRMNSWADASKIKLPAGPPSIASFRSRSQKTRAHSDENFSSFFAKAPAASTKEKAPNRQSQTEAQYIFSPLALSQAYPEQQYSTIVSSDHHSRSENCKAKQNYPSPHPHLLGTPFDSLQTARLMQSLWVAQLTLHTTLYSSPLLTNSFQSFQTWLDSSAEPTITIITTTGPKQISTLMPTEILTREYGRTLASKIALWCDFCTVSAWQSFGPVVALLSLRSTVDWFTLDRAWETQEIGQQQQQQQQRRRRRRQRRLREMKSVKLADGDAENNDGTNDTSTAGVSAPEGLADQTHVHIASDTTRLTEYSRQAEMDKCLDLLRRLNGPDSGQEA